MVLCRATAQAGLKTLVLGGRGSGWKARATVDAIRPDGGRIVVRAV